MQLGTYVDISTAVANPADALAFYQSLGFQPVSNNIVTDGSININLAPSGTRVPLLRYAGCALDSLEHVGIKVQQTGNDMATITSPEGLHIMLWAHTNPVPMPAGTPLTRTPLSRCGKFGEYALPTTDRQASLAFWKKMGFELLFSADEPEAYAILSDDLIVIGIHQTSDFHEPHITYFAPDMADRIAALQADGIGIQPVPPDDNGTISNAAFSGPGDERFFLFQGDI